MYLSLNLFRALNATPASPALRRSKVVGSGTVVLARIVVPGEKPVNVTVKTVFGSIPVPWWP